MTSNDLKNGKISFTNSLDNCIMEFNEIMDDINEINEYIEESEDTSLSRFIYEKNNEIIDEINDLINTINSKKTIIINNVNNEIRRLKQNEDITSIAN